MPEQRGTEHLDLTPQPEVTANVNRDELGHLGLTDAEIDDIVAFLKTLTDGFVVPTK